MHSLATGDGAAFLASRRRALGWSQLELACRLGVSQGLVCRWERGAIVPPVRALLAWAWVLGCGVAIVQPPGGPRDPAPEAEGGAKRAPPPPALDRGYFPRERAEA
jgi:transcriptional regulator with XRE-family HTH domain